VEKLGVLDRNMNYGKFYKFLLVTLYTFYFQFDRTPTREKDYGKVKRKMTETAQTSIYFDAHHKRNTPSLTISFFKNGKSKLYDYNSKCIR
jgi:hypothetical protein